MSTYIRGPICGTDNCPSRLWRIIAGRRTCQYGHVMEGDIEFNNDDDDMTSAGVITRRLNLTTNAIGSFQSSLNTSQFNNSQKTTRDKKIYGEDAKFLFLKSFQFILKRQCQCLIQEMNFPDQFETVVKCIWLEMLKSFNDDDNMHNDPVTDTDVNYSDDDNVAERISRLNKDASRSKLGLHMTSTISILYMASVHMGLPVFTCDFIKWICAARLPYFKSNKSLPKSWRIKLPNYYLELLEGGTPPNNAQYYNKIAATCAKISFNSKFECKINPRPFILKLILLTTLSPEFYFHTMNSIELIGYDDDFELIANAKTHFTSYHLHPELRLMSYFIIIVRWVLICQEERYSDAWISALIEEPSKTETSSKDSVERQVTNLFYDNKDAIFDWDETKTLNYLEWVEKQYLPNHHNDANNADLSIDRKIAKRKLMKIFPMQSGNFPLPPSEHLSFIDHLQENYLQFKNFSDNNYAGDFSRSELILQLEGKLIQTLAMEFAISVDQLKICVHKMERHCMTNLKGK
ncbi:hypothetical protein KAFR_0J00630 [Kazachstania africana CBS 2517]|uniref:Uncharacterized protein n=1 Tax=Kazachstania africana (strain ATCC 22294 / BCRC 22015 / CBS 2517 / CECT 1963 / NBRC 1671 / NRRL Y-8276) TaxID=1071382 RepID=H2B0I1_KAZAF|nr:hypothetical protein KAFR_0J00630 [Kazachstania africana CBS 2517]CCF60131.1 hypothetical protein KAFR_0J00630 [Kazachstania africana CBS 2517]